MTVDETGVDETGVDETVVRVSFRRGGHLPLLALACPPWIF